MIIETSWEYFSISIYDLKHQVSFYNYNVNVLVLHKLESFVQLTNTIFQKLHTMHQEILPVFPPKWFPFEPAEMSV